MGIFDENDEMKKMKADLERKLEQSRGCGVGDFLKQVYILGDREFFVDVFSGYSSNGEQVDSLSSDSVIWQQAIECEAIPEKIRQGIANIDKFPWDIKRAIMEQVYDEVMKLPTYDP